MISSKIMGRLGNQMFQIATAESLAHDKKEETIYTTSVVGASPTNSERVLYANSIFSKINYSHALPDNDMSWFFYKEKSFEYSKIPKMDGNILLEGYFQSEKYFAHNKDLILNTFCFEKVKYITRKFYKDIDYLSSQDYVGVHIRRGDYLKLSHVHSNLSESYTYYENAMNYFKEKKFVFFSDDIQWCKEKFGKNHIYIDSLSDLSDMFLLGLIPNKIIANSSFSWWSAWFFEKPEHKIVAPKNWFENKKNINDSDLIPRRWKRL